MSIQLVGGHEYNQNNFKLLQHKHLDISLILFFLQRQNLANSGNKLFIFQKTWEKIKREGILMTILTFKNISLLAYLRRLKV